MNIIDAIKEPWPWYIAGPLIGLFVPFLLLFDNRKFGISSTFRDFCTYTLKGPADYFKYNLKEHRWRNLFVAGILIGGAISAIYLRNPSDIHISKSTIHDLRLLGITDFSGLVPSDIFSWRALTGLQGFLLIVAGGFLVGFGTRYADGCTSGHAITGLSLFSRASLIAVSGFFAGGLISVFVLFPIIF
jgi:uncharacterized membrane protein YedE/YeeE